METSTFPTDEELTELYALLAEHDRQEAESFAAFEAHKATGLDYKEVYKLPDMVEHHRLRREYFDKLDAAYGGLCAQFEGFKKETVQPSGFNSEGYREHVNKMRGVWERSLRAIPFKAEAQEIKAVLDKLPVRDRSELEKGNFAIYVSSSGTILANIYEVTRTTPKRRFAMARDWVTKEEVKLTAQSSAAGGSMYNHRQASGYKVVGKEIAQRMLAMHLAINGPVAA